MGKHDFEVELPPEPPDPEAIKAPVERTALQTWVTWSALLPVVACALAAGVVGWMTSADASRQITRVHALLAEAPLAIAPFAEDLADWAESPGSVEPAWRAEQSARLRALESRLAGCRLLMAFSAAALIPGFFIWNRGQFGRPEGSPRVDAVQIGLGVIAVALFGGVGYHNVGKAEVVSRFAPPTGLGDHAAALILEGKAKRLAPWRKSLDAAVATLRDQSLDTVRHRGAAEAVERVVRQPESAVLADDEKLALRRTLEALARTHYTRDAFEPLARAHQAFIGSDGVEAMILEQRRETKQFANDDEASEFLFNAIRRDNDAEVRMMIRRGYDVNRPDPCPGGGHTPLHAAVFHRRPVLVHLLLEHGARTDVACTTAGLVPAGDHPAHAAVGDPGLTKALLERGANPNAKNATGRTPLHLAAVLGDRASIRLLVAHKADVNALDHAGQTPLDLANDPAASDAARGAHGLLQELGGLLAADLPRKEPAPTAPVATTPQQP